MYSLASGIYQTYFAPPTLNILIVGAAGSGKTTLLERCKVTQFSTRSNNNNNSSNNSTNTTTSSTSRGGGRRINREPPQSSVPLHSVFFNDDPQDNATAKMSSSGSGPASAMEGTPQRHSMHHHRGHNHRHRRHQGEEYHHVKRAVKRPAETLTQRNKASTTTTSGTSIEQQQTSVKPPRNQSWLCPAPLKYTNSVGDEAKDEKVIIVSPARPTVTPTPRRQSSSGHAAAIPGSARRRSTVDSSGELQDVNLLDDDNDDDETENQSLLNSDDDENDNDDDDRSFSTAGTGRTGGTGGTAGTRRSATEQQQQQQQQFQFDLKKNAHMLPLVKIRPTIGMNLAKNLHICGAHVNLLDLGGRLSDLWERYYNDCHAVIFVWKLNSGSTSSSSSSENDNDDTVIDNNNDDDRPGHHISAQHQLGLLERVRSAIPDDVPFLVVGHLSSDTTTTTTTTTLKNNNLVQTDVLYSTAALLPHYHNNCQALWFANAATGQGVRSAMEWLVPLAAQYEHQWLKMSGNYK